MKSTISRIISRILIASMLVLPFQSAQAGMIGVDQVNAVTAQTDRAGIARVIDRPEIASQLQSMGLDANAAKDRVAAMTDDEVRTLAGKIDSMPAGARVAPWNWVVIIGIAALIYYYYFQKN